MIKLNVPYLKDSDIASVADSFLKQNHVISIPVNIEYVIESRYRMDIVPTPGLLDLADAKRRSDKKQCEPQAAH